MHKAWILPAILWSGIDYVEKRHDGNCKIAKIAAVRCQLQARYGKRRKIMTNKKRYSKTAMEKKMQKIMSKKTAQKRRKKWKTKIHGNYMTKTN